MASDTSQSLDTEAAVPGASPRFAERLARLLRVLFVICLPAFFLLTSVRLVASETFIELEYHRPGFPRYRFGFSQVDHLKYAPYAVRYLHNDAGISYLGDFELDGAPMYTEK